MTFYYDFSKTADGLNTKRTARSLIELRAQLAAEIPPKSVYERLLLATWNIQGLGGNSRTEESLWYITEVLSSFDLIAIQEVKRRLDDLNRIRELLGDWWEYVVTDPSEGDGGNDERLAFLYDKRKVQFGRVAGEVVLAPVVDAHGNEVPATQFVRTPFIVGFESSWFRFMLTTVHVIWGDNARAIPQRVDEIKSVADFLAGRLGQTGTFAKNLILLGEFNIFDAQSPAYQAILDAGFTIPDELTSVPATNVGREPRKYDQIAIQFAEHPNLKPTKAGVFDFFKSAYSDAKLPLYRNELRKADGTLPANPGSYYRNHWRRNQLSDHLVMWVELPIDFAGPYLQRKAT